MHIIVLLFREINRLHQTELDKLWSSCAMYVSMGCVGSAENGNIKSIMLVGIIGCISGMVICAVIALCCYAIRKARHHSSIAG